MREKSWLIRLAIVIAIPGALPAQSVGGNSTEPAAIAGQAEDTSPMTLTAKVKYQTLSLVKPVSLVTTAFSAGISQWRDVPHAWGQGSESYAERFASAEGFAAAHNTVALGFDLALHLDPRYHRQPEATGRARLWNAISQTFIARKDSGGSMINVPEIAGSFGAGFISNTWQPANYNTAQDAVTRGLFSLAFHTVRNVAHEFMPDVMQRVRHRNAPDNEKTGPTK